MYMVLIEYALTPPNKKICIFLHGIRKKSFLDKVQYQKPTTKPTTRNKNPCKHLVYKGLLSKNVVRSGLEPELFWTKTRRVANYTIGQSAIKLIVIGGCKTNKYIFKSNRNLMFF